MSTAPFPRAVQNLIQPRVQPEIQPNRQMPAGVPENAGALHLTIRRITRTHHGRTLQTLGHATEYLVHSRRFMVGKSASEAEDEAVRILRRLSSCVFREYAESVRVRRPVEDFVMGCAAWLLE
ncbi:MAG: hypothetical protein ABI072_05715 [Edaphobacter sp.]